MRSQSPLVFRRKHPGKKLEFFIFCQDADKFKIVVAAHLESNGLIIGEGMGLIPTQSNAFFASLFFCLKHINLLNVLLKVSERGIDVVLI